jgi:acyl CoA:acetate/3-ketoacid CoA transferase beta subunit
MEGFGIMGCAPRPAAPFFGHVSNVRTAKFLTDVGISYSVLVGGAQNKCLATIGAAQIDKYGNINASKIGLQYLVGPGGGADSLMASEVMAVTRQSSRRFLEKVSYVTCPGHNLSTLVSDMGIFEKLGGEELVLTAYIPNGKLSGAEEHIRHIKRNCGWDLKVAKEVKAALPATSEELLILRLLDPQGFFIKW